MARYVCDFGQVSDAGNKLIEAASQMRESINRYTSGIDSSLSGWDGQAKSSYSRQSTNQATIVNKKADYLNDFGEFIVNASKSISELEDELSSIRI